ncbi:MAG: hypothetical protein J0I17_10700 ['Candidatus Kapabacteria' thiocyanatum]|uniref:Uncharacterized protein n=1 Tax=Candidatus Kapaibacterium thiocyanatum TaxID=1895771 RepID=A0A1M3L3P3_9BACT|nr:hypothetical protein ['Candidatus Kapabacteria' thiocyanatum]OJX59956.1 MAG: hypothetical protein BGO89_08150 ['Candidatus Kapabacteria' thiocyanatum]
MARLIAILVLSCLFLVITGEASAHPTTARHRHELSSTDMCGVQTLAVADVADELEDRDPLIPLFDAVAGDARTTVQTDDAYRAGILPADMDQPPIYIAIRRLLI